MQLQAGQVLKFKIHHVNDDSYTVKSTTNHEFQLHKRYCKDHTFIKNQFVMLHVLEEKDGSLNLSPKLPTLKPGEIGRLEVLDGGKSGFFLNNGVERDILLPADEKDRFIKAKDQLLVKIVSGNQGMLKATMKFQLRDMIREDEYHLGNRVKGRVITKILDGKKLKGIQILVENELIVFIHHTEIERRPRLNEIVEARIIFIRPDKKINATLKPHVKDRIEADKKLILDKLFENHGALAISLKSEPEVIKEMLQLSKKAFKRALNTLIEENKVVQEYHKILLK